MPRKTVGIFILVVIGLVSMLTFLTVKRLSQETPVAPTAPVSKPQAVAGSPVPACLINFTVNVPVATPNPTSTPAPQDCVAVDKTAQATAACFTGLVTLKVKGICPVTQRQPLDVLVVFDRSYSMSPRIASAKEAANTFIDKLNPALDRVGLVSFSNLANLDSQLTQDFASVKNILNSLTTTGNTNIAAAFQVAQSEISARRRPEALPVIVLLSDGVATRNLAGVFCSSTTVPTSCTDDALSQATLAKQAGSVVFTIGLAMHSPSLDDPQPVLDFAAQNLKLMASSVDKYYDSPTTAELIAIYDSIITVITGNLTTNAVITEILPDGVHLVPGSAQPPPTEINGQTLIWNLGSISSDQEIVITFEVTFDTGAPNQLVNIYPDSRLNYTDINNFSYIVPFPETRLSPLICQSSPEPSPSPEPQAMCVGIKFYTINGSGNWQMIADPDSLQPGDIIYISVLGDATSGIFDKARFRVNGQPPNWTETTLVNPFGEFYIEYTIPQLSYGQTSFNVEAEIHHVNLGWR